MYKKIIGLLVLVCFCFLVSCRVTRQENQKQVIENQFVNKKFETYRDTVLFAPKAETSLKLPVSELVFKDSLKSISKPRYFTQKNGNATAKIKIVHDTITVTATCDSLAIVAQIKHELEQQSNTSNNAINNSKETQTGYTFWDIIKAFIAGLGAGFIINFILKISK